MTQKLFAQKRTMTEAYLGDKRVAVTLLKLYPAVIIREKSIAKEGYDAKVVSFGNKKRHPNKAQKGMHKDISVKDFVREVKELSETPLTPGMIVNVQATSKGKGNAGVMKRWNFAGGPRTHGQSDRARAPGSIGQGTTPGRVLKGRHMAGRMGSDTVTIKNLPVVAVDAQAGLLWIAGPVPGHTKAMVTISVTDQTTKLEELKFLKGYDPKAEVIAEDSIEAAPEEAVVEEVTL